MKFGQFLIEKGLCSEDQVKCALTIAPFRKERLGRLLVELGFLSSKSLDSALIQFFRPDTKMTYQEMIELKKQVPLEVQGNGIFAKTGTIPIQFEADRITVVSGSFSDHLIHKIEVEYNRNVCLVRVRDAVFQLLQGKEISSGKQEASIVVAGDLNSDQKILEKNPYAHLIKECLEQACRVKASDIHFEPFADQYLIRLRIHGVLQDWKVLSANHAEPLINKLKWILNLDLAIAGKPQDSRATFQFLGVDIRVNSMPIATGGEKIVLRVQYREEKLSLEQIGLSPEKIEILRRNIQKREGLIVISGPTGSGKTTTLYALLEEMDRLGKNISTLENPVEKSLERINQSNVATKEDFYEFQRALMRQDPDVILLGEIRDPDTADLGMKLASTGHLVLSTVHANGAREVIDRLLNLGIDEFTINNNLRLSVAQRLVRRLCQHCRIPWEEGFIVNQSGCAQCQKGIVGRVAVIEYLEKQDLEGKTMPTTLRRECELLAKKGVIDVSEIATLS